MVLRVKSVERFSDGPNCWYAVAPESDSGWLEHLAKTYRDLRTQPIIPLNDVVFDGLTFKVDTIKAHLRSATIPEKGNGVLRVERSDFGETISYCLLQDEYDTKFGYKSLRDREVVQLSGRGIDAIGAEVDPTTGRLRLILGETKTSAEARNPPQVVDSGKDCLRSQHLDHLSKLPVTTGKVFDAARRARDADAMHLLMAAALMLAAGNSDKLDIVCFSCLVRPHDLYRVDDFGTFKSSPTDFLPSILRFTTFCVPEELETTVDQFLELARRGDQE